jgi:hypothetical protein
MYQATNRNINQAIIFFSVGALCGVGFLSGGLSFFGVFRGVFFLFVCSFFLRVARFLFFQIQRGGCFAAFLFSLAFALFKLLQAAQNLRTSRAVDAAPRNER